MNDAKTKLGQVKPYSFDADGFKSQLKSKLMQEYKAQYGIEEDFAIEVSESKSFFSFNKLILTPVMALLVLAVFISYEYVTKPMTAYAYLKKVERRNKSLENGFKVNTVHTIDGYTLNVDVKKDKSGDVRVSVRQDGNEVENFVMSDGVLYVKETFDLKQERATELTSVLSSLMLAELSDPRSEWRDLMERDDVDLSEEEDGSVKISYEESLGGETFVNELYFRDYAPVKRVRVAKTEERRMALETSVSPPKMETIEYREIMPVAEEIEKPVDYVVFVDNVKFNEKISEFADTELDDLVREYSSLPEKEVYFVWDEMVLREVEPEPVVIESDKHVEAETPLVRDTYLEEVFYDLLGDDEKPSEPDDGLKEVPPAVEVVVPPVRDFSNIELPRVETEKRIDLESDLNDEKTVDLIDHSVPEPYMAEPMDDPLNTNVEEKPKEDTVNTAPLPSVTDLIRDRSVLQQDLANRRFQLRMERDTEKLNPVERVIESAPPVDEFKKE